MPDMSTIFLFLMLGAVLAAYFTHIGWFLFNAGKFLGLAGVLVPIIGIIHGIAIWFGVRSPKRDTVAKSS
jgi:hypothetical protein